MAAKIKCRKRLEPYKIHAKTDDKVYFPQTDVNVWTRTCEREITTPIAGIKNGTIPTWLTGCLFRNGPGSLRVGKHEFKHLFDGSALIHRFNIRNGNVTYQCKFVCSNVYAKNWQAQRIVVTDFGTSSVPDPCQSIFDKFKSLFSNETSDNPNITVYPFEDELYALSEAPALFKIDRESLKTIAKIDLNDYVSIVHHSSHPHVTPDGAVYSLGMSISMTGPQHVIMQFPSRSTEGKRSVFESCRVVAQIAAKWKFHPSYMHSFGLTANYFVIIEQPLTLSVPKILWAKVRNKPTASTLKWFEEHCMQINVVSRRSGRLVRRFQTDSFFYLHVINQYECDDHLILDICCYKDASMLECMYVESMKGMNANPNYAKMFRSKPLRFVLPLTDAKDVVVGRNLIRLQHTNAEAYRRGDEIYVVPEVLCDVGCETPTINYGKYLGKPYRYFYAMSSDVDGQYPGMLIKVDTIKKSCAIWHEKNCYASEPIFVPMPDAGSEDDGVLLSSLVWGGNDENHVTLLILNAKTMREIGRCDFRTQSPVPKCLHGWFLPDKKISTTDVI